MSSITPVCWALRASWSQDAPPVRVRGTIERIESPVFLVKSRDGAELKIVLADNAVAVGVFKATLADIKPVGIGAMPQADGTQRARAVPRYERSIAAM